MSGYRSFAKNVGLLTIANFGTKFLSFFLVPLYTSVLTTAEYGIYDLVNTTIGILIPVLTQNIVDAVLRFSIGSGDGASKVLGIGLRHLLISLVPVCIFLGANYAVCFLPSIRELSLLIFLMYLSQALSGMVLYYARGANRFGDIAVSSVFCSVITLCLNVVFLVFLKWGLPGYFVANIVGPLLQSIFLLVRVGFHGASPVRVDKGLERSMLEYSRPLVANSAAWWVNNVSDRYIVTFFAGFPQTAYTPSLLRSLAFSVSFKRSLTRHGPFRLLRNSIPRTVTGFSRECTLSTTAAWWCSARQSS